MRILFLGDVVGRPGRKTVVSYLSEHSSSYDLVVVNGENAAGGFGITPDISRTLLDAGADVITSGNHIWKKESIIPLLSDQDTVVLRPANYPKSKPGTGWTIRDVAGVSVQVINLQGKVFTDFSGDCPFKTVDSILSSTRADVRVIDFHAEATSEKLALAHYVDGRVNIFVGTHTHVQTADAQVLPGGMAYISDLGMCGSSRGVIGMETKSSIAKINMKRYKIQMPY